MADSMPSYIFPNPQNVPPQEGTLWQTMGFGRRRRVTVDSPIVTSVPRVQGIDGGGGTCGAGRGIYGNCVLSAQFCSKATIAL